LRSSRCGNRLATFHLFEFNLETLELIKSGVRLRLENKPANALLCLIDRRGQVVKRNELVALLWPGESHGDFNHRLNKVINKLRQVLGDDPSQAHFIQTLKGRGYRFVADASIVEPAREAAVLTAIAQLGTSTLAPSSPISSADPGIALAQHCNLSRSLELPTSALPAAAPGEPSGRETNARGQALPRTIPLQRPFSSRTSTQAAFFGIVAIVLVGTSMLSARLSQTKAPRPRARKSIAVVSFSNLSESPGDAWLSRALAGWITTDLANQEQVRVIATDAAAGMRADSVMQGGDKLSRDGLAKLRKNLGPDFIVSGSYATLGSGDESTLRLDLQIQDTESAQILYTISLRGRKADAFALVASAGIQLRQALKSAAFAPDGLETVREILPHNLMWRSFYLGGP
jgi:DNA-binding winged helix-turn-helix (wHTH) protein/TolB-like protein